MSNNKWKQIGSEKVTHGARLTEGVGGLKLFGHPCCFKPSFIRFSKVRLSPPSAVAAGAPVRWTGLNFPTGINLIQCSRPQKCSGDWDLGLIPVVTTMPRETGRKARVARRVRQICRILSSFIARCLPLSNMSSSLAVCKSICVPCKLIGILTFCLIRLPGHVARHEGCCFIWNYCKTRQVVWKVERKGVVARCRFEALRPHRQAIAQNSLTFIFRLVNSLFKESRDVLIHLIS